MANAQSSKGNPAGHRMSNPKLKERRQKSWARGEARKKLHVKANDARKAANDAKLAAAGLTRTKTAVEYMVDGKLRTKYVPDSPQRTFRLAGLEFPED